MKEWEEKVAGKVDHGPSHDDDLPPIRSGRVSMTKPGVRGINCCSRFMPNCGLVYIFCK